MAKRTLLIVGAAGDVGRGIVAAALDAGWNVVAAGRDREKLDAVAARHRGLPVACVAGDIAGEAGAVALWDSASAAFGGVDAAVVSVNALGGARPLAEWTADALVRNLANNVATHFAAARTFLPRLPGTGMLIGIGGGTADFILPGLAPMSMAQAALRMLYRGLAKERRGGAQLCELMVVSMIAGVSNRASAPPEWLTAEEVGRHVCTILAAPDSFAGPVLQLRSREQVGQPELPALRERPEA